MSRMIFVSLPVADLPAAKRFYAAIGFTNEPRFTDETAAAMVWSEAIVVMLVTQAKWRTFTDRPMPDPASSGHMLGLSCESRDEVNRLVDSVGAAGGTPDINPGQDHGFMMDRSFADLDGHLWEFTWMDAALADATPADATPAEATA